MPTARKPSKKSYFVRRADNRQGAWIRSTSAQRAASGLSNYPLYRGQTIEVVDSAASHATVIYTLSA